MTPTEQPVAAGLAVTTCFSKRLEVIHDKDPVPFSFQVLTDLLAEFSLRIIDDHRCITVRNREDAWKDIALCLS